MGLDYWDGKIIAPNYIVLTQIASYAAIVSSAVFILLHYTDRLKQNIDWERKRKERVRNAISLALEYNAFPDLTNKVKFLYAHESRDGFFIDFTVGVQIDQSKYEIIVDNDASSIKRVFVFS